MKVIGIVEHNKYICEVNHEEQLNKIKGENNE